MLKFSKCAIRVAFFSLSVMLAACGENDDKRESSLAPAATSASAVSNSPVAPANATNAAAPSRSGHGEADCSGHRHERAGAGHGRQQPGQRAGDVRPGVCRRRRARGRLGDGQAVRWQRLAAAGGCQGAPPGRVAAPRRHFRRAAATGCRTGADYRTRQEHCAAGIAGYFARHADSMPTSLPR